MLIILTQTKNHSSRQMLIKYRKQSQNRRADELSRHVEYCLLEEESSIHPLLQATQLESSPYAISSSVQNRLPCKTSHLAEELLEEVHEITEKDDVSKDLLCTTMT